MLLFNPQRLRLNGEWREPLGCSKSLLSGCLRSLPSYLDFHRRDGFSFTNSTLETSLANLKRNVETWLEQAHWQSHDFISLNEIFINWTCFAFCRVCLLLQVYGLFAEYLQREASLQMIWVGSWINIWPDRGKGKNFSRTLVREGPDSKKDP